MNINTVKVSELFALKQGVSDYQPPFAIVADRISNSWHSMLYGKVIQPSFFCLKQDANGILLLSEVLV